MKLIKIKETYDIIRGYRTSEYHVEAESIDDAIEMINNGEVDPIKEDLDIRDTEFENREIL